MAKSPWVVIDTVEDSSFATIFHTDVIYEEPLLVGQMVRFFWNSKQYSGKVCVIDESREVCIQEANKLNDHRSRSGRKVMASLEGKTAPRKSAEVCRNNFPKKGGVGKGRGLANKPKVQQIKKKSNKKVIKELKSAMETLTQKRLMKIEQAHKGGASSPLGTLLKCVDSSDSEQSDDKSDEDMLSDGDVVPVVEEGHDDETGIGKKAEGLASLNAEEHSQNEEMKEASNRPNDGNLSLLLKLAQQLAGNIHDSQIAALLKGNNSGNAQEATDSSSKTSASHNVLTTAPDKDTSINVSASRASPNVPTSALFAKQMNRRYVSVFDGNMFRAIDLPDSDRVDIGGGIFCDALSHAMACNSTSTTQAARQLLVGVFTDRALFSCTITGLPPRCKGRDSYSNGENVKPPLCAKAVNAIVEYALKLEKEKYWRPKKTVKDIRSALSTKLCEIRKYQF